METVLDFLIRLIIPGLIIYIILGIADIGNAFCVIRLKNYRAFMLIFACAGVVLLVLEILALFILGLESIVGMSRRLIGNCEKTKAVYTIDISMPPQEAEPELSLEGEDLYRSYVHSVCESYDNVDPYMIEAMIFHESRWEPDAENYNGTCVGLMQLSTKWHAQRAEELGVQDITDPYGNILLGVDYVSRLTDAYEDPALVLMMYHMRHDRAQELYNQGILSGYTKSVLSMTEELRKEAA